MKDRYINDLLAKQAYISDNLARKDPFDKAIRKAVESAKKSIKMDEDQEDKALRNSLLTWSEEMHKMPRTKGLLANFAQAGRALLPALKTHDIYEDAAEEENLKMLQHAQQKKAAEEAKAAQLEAAAYQREMADKQLAHQGAMLEEQKRYHNQSLFAKLAKAAQKKEGEFKEYEGKTYRTLNKADQSKAGDAKAIANAAAIKDQDMNKSFEDLEKLGKENWFHPLGRGSSIINPIKDTIGNVFGVEDLQKETALRNLFIAELGQLRTIAERLNTGTNGITQGMYDRLSPYFADPKNDSLPTLKMKIDHLSKEIQDIQKAATIKHEQGIHFDVGDLETPTIESDFVLMLDPKTGKKDSIHKSWVQDAINNDGLQVVNE
jgi:hypothetical protein